MRSCLIGAALCATMCGSVLAAPGLVFDNGPVNTSLGGYSFSGPQLLADDFILSTATTLREVRNLGLFTFDPNTPVALTWTITR